MNVLEHAKAFYCLEMTSRTTNLTEENYLQLRYTPPLGFFIFLDSPSDEPCTRRSLQTLWPHLSWPLDSFQEQ